jgi:hypothetical protein
LAINYWQFNCYKIVHNVLMHAYLHVNQYVHKLIKMYRL